MSMDQLLEQFISEARELLESSATAFLALEKTPDDTDVINGLFRAVHTLKGTSGIFDIGPLTGVVHAGEDVLDLVREGKLELNADDIDLFLDSLDQVSAWLDDLENNGVLPDDATSVGKILSERLRKLMAVDGDQLAEQESVSTSEEGILTVKPASLIAACPAWVEPMMLDVPDNTLRSWYREIHTNTLTAIRYQPDSQCFFSGDDPINNAIHVPDLRWHDLCALNDWENDENFDPYHCNLLFHFVSQASEDDIAFSLRYIDNETELFTLTQNQLLHISGEIADSSEYTLFISDADQFVANEDWDGLKTAVSVAADLASPGFIQTSALQWMNTIMAGDTFSQDLLKHLIETIRTGEWIEPKLDSVDKSAVAAENEEEKTVDQPVNMDDQTSTLTTPEESIPRPSSDDMDCACSILRVQIESLSLPCSADMWAGRHASIIQLLNGFCGFPASLNQVALISKNEHSFHTILAWVEALLVQWKGAGGISQSLDIAADVAMQDASAAGVGTEGPESKTRKQTFLRVEQERIDQLMDLVGELVVAKNALPFLSDKAENEFGVKALAREIKGQYEVVNRLAEEFQTIVMRIRMVSVSTVFQRFPRLVRDLSRRLNKNIELVVEGEDTEADKNVVEALSDPLIHLVRNSLDHGIEMPEDRAAAGKSEMGRITLRAVQQEDQVLIEVIDDGKGLDPEALKQKAFAKGLIDEERLEAMSDYDALQLILMAGFSMAEEVSDLSGRGVGMDVVNSMVQQAGGSISLHSKLGEGSTVRLSLPLSMAVTRVMMVSVDKQRFGVGIEQIVETVKVSANEIHRVKNNEAIVLRDRLIPLCHLRDALDMENAQLSHDDEISILVVSIGDNLLGLVVDEFHAGLDIIQKPLEGVMTGFSLFSGTALLGDGTVLLIVNLKELSTCQ